MNANYFHFSRKSRLRRNKRHELKLMHICMFTEGLKVLQGMDLKNSVFIFQARILHILLKPFVKINQKLTSTDIYVVFYQ